MKTNHIFLFLFFLLVSTQMHAQYVISSYGGMLSQGDVSCTITVGEIFTNKFSSPEVMFSTGVTQPAVGDIPSSVLPIEETHVRIMYDSFSQTVRVRLDEQKTSIWSCEVYTLKGLMTNKVHSTGAECVVSLDGLSPGVFILKINANNNTKAYKLLK